MPKYYRFRATTPTRKPRPVLEKCIKKEVQKAEQPLNMPDDFFELALMCDGPAWYRRRTAWRQGPTFRQISASEAARGFLQFIKHTPGILEAPFGLKPNSCKPYSLERPRGNNA